MSPRLFVDLPLEAGTELALPDAAVRHVQVLRLQPGAGLALFNGRGGQWRVRVQRVGRRDVVVQVLDHEVREAELPLDVTLALGMPANERMDALVEKAVELGAAAIQPLVCERSVLRLAGDRAERRAAHWQAVANAACEQCGRNRVPRLAAPLPLSTWLDTLPATGVRWLLSLSGDARAARELPWPQGGLTVLSGPEGGLGADEQAQARARGFQPVGLGPRVLRADTAPLALLAWLGMQAPA